MKRKILILEDEENIRTFVKINLKRADFEVVEAATGEEALEAFAASPDIAVAVLDVMLPGIDGYEVCRSLRASGFIGGIIMLTARVMDSDKVTGLMTGADDYVTKPFSVNELLARIEALYRRVSGSLFASTTLRNGPFKLDLRSREFTRFDKKIELTQVEQALVKMFLENIGKALDRDEIFAKIWGKEYTGDLKIVDVNIRRLRMKIEDDPAVPQFLRTVRGFGYIWE